MTHGKDLKNTTHFWYECDKRSEIQDEKTGRSTVKVQKSVQIFKKDRKVHTHVYEQRKSYIAMNKKANELMPQKKDTPPRRKRSFLTWTIWEHEVWWSGEYFAGIQHSWTRANLPVNPTCSREQHAIELLFSNMSTNIFVICKALCGKRLWDTFVGHTDVTLSARRTGKTQLKGGTCFFTLL